MYKLSKGVLIYLSTFIIGWTLNVTQQWSKIFKTILSIGLKTSQELNIIEQLCSRQFTIARLSGTVVGGIIALIVIIGLFNRRSWARKTIVIFALISTLVYIIKKRPALCE